MIASTRDPDQTKEFWVHKEHSIDAGMTVANDVPYTVAYLANSLGLPGISLKQRS